MPGSLVCPHCGARLRYSTGGPPSRARCPKCRAVFRLIAKAPLQGNERPQPKEVVQPSRKSKAGAEGRSDGPRDLLGVVRHDLTVTLRADLAKIFGVDAAKVARAVIGLVLVGFLVFGLTWGMKGLLAFSMGICGAGITVLLLCVLWRSRRSILRAALLVVVLVGLLLLVVWLAGSVVVFAIGLALSLTPLGTLLLVIAVFALWRLARILEVESGKSSGGCRGALNGDR